MAFNIRNYMRLHTDELYSFLLLWRRRREIPGMDHPWTAQEALKLLWEKLKWNCTVALESPVNDVYGVGSYAEIVMPDPTAAEGKRLAKAALDMEPRAWLAERAVKLEADVRYVVTISRRRIVAVRANDGKVPKADRSYINKVVHCLVRELAAVQKLIANYDTQPRQKGEPKPE